MTRDVQNISASTYWYLSMLSGNIYFHSNAVCVGVLEGSGGGSDAAKAYFIEAEIIYIYTIF